VILSRSNSKVTLPSPPVQQVEQDYQIIALDMRQGTPRIQAKVNGLKREFIVDSGAGVSIIKPGVYRSKIRPTATSTMAATGHILDFIGEQDVPLPLNGRNYGHTICVNFFPIKTEGILGMDFLTATGATLDLGKRQLKMWKCPALRSSNMDRRVREPRTEVNQITRLRTPSNSQAGQQGNHKLLRLAN